MQRSENKVPLNNMVDGQVIAGKDLAVLIESLYVANLLVLPGLAFLALLYIFMKKRHSLPALAKSHLDQTMSACIWIAAMLLVATTSVLAMRYAGVEDVTLWMIVVMLFTILHASMVFLGILGLAKALAGKCFRYPVVGKPLPDNCAR
ncbi:MAG: hypothetical protein LJE83_06900 [Gammaproteobacteria bacterium]|jgi:uncharacterized Tic20 family protein|nr:hypothetical protein [Gammaproteobacteria bacterium]